MCGFCCCVFVVLVFVFVLLALACYVFKEQTQTISFFLTIHTMGLLLFLCLFDDLSIQFNSCYLLHFISIRLRDSTHLIH